MKYAITVELEYETTGDPYERAHDILRLVLQGHKSGHLPKFAEHYHLLGAPRKLGYTNDETRDEEARRTEEDAQPYWNNE